MKYAVIKCSNGSYAVHTEGFMDLSKAKVSYHDLCKTLWNAPDVVTAKAMLVDEQLNCVDNCKEFIHHDPETEPEPETETTEGE